RMRGSCLAFRRALGGQASRDLRVGEAIRPQLLELSCDQRLSLGSAENDAVINNAQPPQPVETPELSPTGRAPLVGEVRPSGHPDPRSRPRVARYAYPRTGIVAYRAMRYQAPVVTPFAGQPPPAPKRA